jgi:hypothetical protein
MCNSAAGTHIFFDSATGPLELALGTVATRGGCDVNAENSIQLLRKENRRNC